MKVFVAVPGPNHGLVALKFSEDDTVGNVKAKLHDMVGIPPSRQRLVFACSALADNEDTTLGDHGVTDSSTIQLVETKMEVFVHCTHRSCITISGAESCDTVESFRLRVQEQDGIGFRQGQQRDGIGIRPAQQRLMLGGRQLEDGHTLADYGVRNHTLITLLFRWTVNLRSRAVELDIDVTDTVGRIKERVEEAEGVPVACQSVSFHGMELDDGRELADYDYVVIVCERQKRGRPTNNTTTKVKRRAYVDVTGLRKKNKKRKKMKKKLQLAEMAKIPAVRRRFTVYLLGPGLEICPSSCDTDAV